MKNLGRLLTFILLTATLGLAQSQINSFQILRMGKQSTAPANPPINASYVYFDGTNMVCVTSAGASCLASSGGSGTVTSVGLAGTTNQITVTGTTPITGSGSWTLSLPSSLVLPSATTATTQSSGDNTTSVATTAFVASAIQGVNPAVAVKAATAAVLPNSPTYNNGASGIGAFLTTATLNTALVVDGVTIGLGDRVLVKNQASSLQNGVYYETQLQTVGLPWILTRALDFDMPSDMNNTGAIPVISGTVNAVTQWVISSSVTTVGTDAVTFAQFSANPATLAPLASPTFTGTPAAPTASVGTNTTQLATTAFVVANSAMVQLETHTASTSATLDFTTCFTSTYHNYEIEFNNLVPATNAQNLHILYSTNGGGTWDTTAGHYAWGVLLFNSGGVANDGSVSDTKQVLNYTSGNISSTANLGGLSGNYRIHDPLGAHYTQLNGTSNYVGSGTNPSTGIINSATYIVTSGAVNAFRVLFSSGNITSGTVTCYGITP